ncbi:tRNA(His) guanylyltransferase Thg1 family protein [Hahella aquimaris]|uniref:tRNA(His) guanylyltransferase Thg1 family protein n=1 Tax=Hahella sp. HNIBRBA332 TaxID=3015983 RepID=UPI00273C6545|nr:tRNA(His) guanylyltransferase Thg1 family protein [Hahella sp. HNIBRBA332]WLQ13424.1 tRNA(His) guanylyltransferase Thg1 family protein [Hahella sp. HNIBRBA332]
MKFNDLDKKMRVYETAHDFCVLPGMYIVARIDGRGFTKLTKETHDFEAPFDVRFRDMMVATVDHLMNSGFNIVYGYTQSDEISLLFHPDDNSFNRKERKLNSLLAGEASAKFSLMLGDIGAFDCRICQLPNPRLVVDYFRWRNEDAHRNALNAHCYWAMRKEGVDPETAAASLSKVSIANKNELLFQKGVNFNELPNWQKRGVGLYWEQYEKEALNPKTGESVTALRKRLKVDYELPMKDKYSAFIETAILQH